MCSQLYMLCIFRYDSDMTVYSIVIVPTVLILILTRMKRRIGMNEFEIPSSEHQRYVAASTPERLTRTSAS